MKNVKKVIKKCFTALHAAESLLYFNGDSGDVVFICNETGILNNISLDNINNISLHNNFDKEDPGSNILVRPLAWHIEFEKRNQRIIDPMFIEELYKWASVYTFSEFIKDLQHNFMIN